jgi:hypothetical protein
MNTVHERYVTPKSKRIANNPDKHISNKNEGKKLRQIMSETGLTEEQIRGDKKYRIELSQAQKEGLKAKHGQVEKWYRDRIKDACKKTGLVPQHPDTIKALNEILKSYIYIPSYVFHFNSQLLTAKSVIKKYCK